MQQQQDIVEKTIRKPFAELAVTPKSLSRVRLGLLCFHKYIKKHTYTQKCNYCVHLFFFLFFLISAILLFFQDTLHSWKLQQGPDPSPGEPGEGARESPLLYDDHGDSVN